MRRLFETLTNDLLLKLTALGLAFLLWTLVKTDNEVSIDGIAVDVANRDAEWILAKEPDPAAVRVVFSGPMRELVRVAAERPQILVPLDSVRDSVDVIVLRPNWVTLGNGVENVRVNEIRPAAVRLEFDKVTSRVLPVVARVVGSPMPGYALAGPVTVEPSTVRASGASRLLDSLDTLRLPPIDLTRRAMTDTMLIRLDSLGPGLITVPGEVRAIIPIRPVDPDTTISGASERES